MSRHPTIYDEKSKASPCLLSVESGDICAPEDIDAGSLSTVIVLVIISLYNSR